MFMVCDDHDSMEKCVKNIDQKLQRSEVASLFNTVQKAGTFISIKIKNKNPIAISQKP